MSKLLKSPIGVALLVACCGLTLWGVYLISVSVRPPLYGVSSAEGTWALVIGIASICSAVILAVATIRNFLAMESATNLAKDESSVSKQEVIRRANYLIRADLAKEACVAFKTAIVAGKSVTHLRSSVWLDWWAEGTILLASVRLEDGSCRLLSYENGKIYVPQGGGCSWVLDNLSSIPRLEMDGTDVRVWCTDSKHLLASYGYDRDDLRPEQAPRWRFSNRVYLQEKRA